ncbi:Solute carrier family 2, facilitated glucose transporter member 6 [Chelonia mydas]|uniref:Solute carrier family 2, facilitated glucose transporter member 6 n=1 Tax=Chelonia mydas TaxID=8469 RepID=M7B9I8_CHEMY|nr:Solute carrier family 2, facilitated glucose transporter member 6 [Chelonia mydas]
MDASLQKPLLGTPSSAYQTFSQRDAHQLDREYIRRRSGLHTAKRPLTSPFYPHAPESVTNKIKEGWKRGAQRTLQNKRLFLAAFAAVLGNFNFGYALVYTSPVIPALETSNIPALKITRVEESWFGSVFTLGAAAGGLSAMLLNDRLGRKLSIMFSAVPSAVGYAFMGSAQGVWMLLLGRLLTG